MKDSRRGRMVLVLLLAISFALITVDIHGGRNSPISHVRDWASAVFGPAERATASAVDPVGRAIDAVRDAGNHEDEKKRLQEENARLRQELQNVELDKNRVADLDRLLKVASAGQYKIEPARVVAVGPAQGFSWTVTIDAGSRDGIKPDMTVINGEGLVGRVTSVGPMTATVLLATDPGFSVGSRMAASMEIGITTGQGDRPMRLQLLNAQAQVKTGDRLVTFGSQGGRPFVPGVPVGTVTEIRSTPGALTRTVEVKPFVKFTSLDNVGVVIEPPRSDPRDAVLPAAADQPPAAPAAPAAPAPPAAPAAAVPPATPPPTATGKSSANGRPTKTPTGRD
ncbi:rod shape-determining protein MreC [Yinghuangia seranimata]|uniref:rod shape-determining protein MreC n=1 Tax=Yinghuangia seranimata TaxID=408067 RepID=UPI00248ABDE1|nr:rod shape-determining protein MreC [Yinghuangia seranimata]MDI2127377.1 rod shape-determining protein MreC [Yinghuangia seranimata]